MIYRVCCWKIRRSLFWADFFIFELPVKMNTYIKIFSFQAGYP